MELNIIIISVATYVIYATLLFRIAHQFHHPSPYLAFVPIANIGQFLGIGKVSPWWIGGSLLPPLMIDLILFFVLSEYPFWILLVFFGLPLMGLLILGIQIIRAGMYIAAQSNRSPFHGVFMMVPYVGLGSLFVLGNEPSLLTKDDKETIESIVGGLKLNIPKEEIKKVALGSGVEGERFDILLKRAEKQLGKN